VDSDGPSLRVIHVRAEVRGLCRVIGADSRFPLGRGHRIPVWLSQCSIGTGHHRVQHTPAGGEVKPTAESGRAESAPVPDSHGWIRTANEWAGDE
jgi:hypothetical protein